MWGRLSGPVGYKDLMRDFMAKRGLDENYGQSARSALKQWPSQYIDQRIVDKVSEILRRQSLAQVHVVDGVEVIASRQAARALDDRERLGEQSPARLRVGLQ